jgi:hypothetical protein
VITQKHLAGGFAVVLAMVLLCANESYAAVDSYRYMHVTVETPYTIFLFLLAGILAPFLLMGILVWRFIGRKHGEDEEQPSALSSGQKDGGE